MIENPSFLNIVSDVIRNDAPAPQHNDWWRDTVSSPHTYRWLVGIGIGSVVAALFGFLMLFDPVMFGLGLILIPLGGGGIYLSKQGIQFLWQQRAAFAAADHDERLHQRQLELTRTAQRTDYLDSLSQVEIARETASGKLSEADRIYLEQKESKRVRNHELRRDKQSQNDDWRKLLKKQKHALALEEKRIRTATDVTEDERAAFDIDKAVMDAIDNEPDLDKQERMWRRWDRRVSR
jgi:hypothetical protein